MTAGTADTGATVGTAGTGRTSGTAPSVGTTKSSGGPPQRSASQLSYARLMNMVQGGQVVTII